MTRRSLEKAVGRAGHLPAPLTGSARRTRPSELVGMSAARKPPASAMRGRPSRDPGRRARTSPDRPGGGARRGRTELHPVEVGDRRRPEHDRSVGGVERSERARALGAHAGQAPVGDEQRRRPLEHRHGPRGVADHDHRDQQRAVDLLARVRHCEPRLLVVGQVELGRAGRGGSRRHADGLVEHAGRRRGQATGGARNVVEAVAERRPFRLRSRRSPRPGGAVPVPAFAGKPVPASAGRPGTAWAGEAVPALAEKAGAAGAVGVGAGEELPTSRRARRSTDCRAGTAGGRCRRSGACCRVEARGAR